MNLRNVFTSVFVAGVVAGTVVSCGGGYGSGTYAPAPASVAVVVRSAVLTKDQEVPPITATGTGRGAVVVNPTTMEITGGISFTGLSGVPTDASIYQGASGTNGTGFISLILGSDNATIPANTVLTNAQYTALLANGLYFNVKTAANINGEIRGQITGTIYLIAGLATLDSTHEVPANASTATGRGTIVVDSITYEIITAYVTHNVTSANAAHIHVGAPGVDTPAPAVGLNLVGTLATAQQGLLLSLQNVMDLSAGNFYFNVHSPTYAGGEIRGQIILQ